MSTGSSEELVTAALKQDIYQLAGSRVGWGYQSDCPKDWDINGCNWARPKTRFPYWIGTADKGVESQ